MKKTIVAIAASLAIAGTAAAQDARPMLTLDTASTIRDTCQAFAEENGQSVSIAVFDHTGRLVTFAHMDAASTATSDMAQWKGKSAAVYGFSSNETRTWNAATAPELSVVGGGVPIFMADGTHLGAIGVSGAPTAVDVQCGEAGIAAAGLLAERP